MGNKTPPIQAQMLNVDVEKVEASFRFSPAQRSYISQHGCTIVVFDKQTLAHLCKQFQISNELIPRQTDSIPDVADTQLMLCVVESPHAFVHTANKLCLLMTVALVVK